MAKKTKSKKMRKDGVYYYASINCQYLCVSRALFVEDCFEPPKYFFHTRAHAQEALKKIKKILKGDK